MSPKLPLPHNPEAPTRRGGHGGCSSGRPPLPRRTPSSAPGTLFTLALREKRGAWRGGRSTSGILRGLWDTALKSLPSVLVSGWRQQRRQQQRRPPPTPSTSRHSLTTAAQTQARPDPRPRLRVRPPPSTTTATSSSSSSTAATISTATARSRSLSCIVILAASLLGIRVSSVPHTHLSPSYLYTPAA
ncbi:hypothetical protein E2C01_001765 [Portunus trituberculatus]|uniref:Uncharacterized protein n=1 Tax=Portunus trituberculatus TaxID=210409 RepID=A0A5B7CK36_PORTR|nr:hypothetical protein [Portunus trituberculatus]